MRYSLRVTMPNGKVYTYSNPKRFYAARNLAQRSGAKIERIIKTGGALMAKPDTLHGQPCPHGDVFGQCDRGACDEINFR